MYGYELAETLDRQSEGVLAMGHSTLYAMLQSDSLTGCQDAAVRACPEGTL